MGNMDGIIIYRSRSEAEVDRLIWESPELMGSIFAFMIAIIGSILISFKLYELVCIKCKVNYKKQKQWQWLVWVMTALQIPVYFKLITVTGKFLILAF